jgi:hypothetical protein
MESEKPKDNEDISLWITWGGIAVFSRDSIRKTEQKIIDPKYFLYLHLFN